MQIDIPIDISDKPKRQPPPRFAASLKSKEDVDLKETKNQELPVIDSRSTIDKMPNDTISQSIRKVVCPLCVDSATVFTKDSCISELERVYPDFNTMKTTLDTMPKWQDKVEALERFQLFISTNSASLESSQEAIIQYVSQFSNNFKAANINLLKMAFSIAKTLITSCGAGPRTCRPVIEACISKIHDKKMGPDVTSLLSTICEKIGPNSVINIILSCMTSCRFPLQQKAVLCYLGVLSEEFGAMNINVKDVLEYVMGPMGLKDSHSDVKDNATQVICVLYRQLGSIIVTMVEQGEISDLLRKSVLDAIALETYDTSLSVRYSTEPSPSANHSTTSFTVPPPTISLSDLIDAYDATNDMAAFIIAMRTVGDKDSWKVRQDGVTGVIELMERKKLVVNNKAIGDALSVLKERLSETNLNLRAKVLLCIASIARAVGHDIMSYNNILIAEMMKICGDTKQNVIDSLYKALTAWVDHPETPNIMISILPFLPQGMKAVTGRQNLLPWINKYIKQCEGPCVSTLTDGVMDCLVDKNAAVRGEAQKIMEVICNNCSQNEIESHIKGRPSPDIKAIHAIVSACYATIPAVSNAIQRDFELPVESPPTAATSSLEQKKASLANRVGVRLLGRPKSGEAKSRFSNIKSSIPKPQPPSRSSDTRPTILINRSSTPRISSPKISMDYAAMSEPEPSIRVSVAADGFFLSHPRRGKSERERRAIPWTVHSANNDILKEDCRDCIAEMWVERMFSSKDDDYKEVFNIWMVFVTNDIDILIDFIDLVLKYTSLRLLDREKPAMMSIYLGFLENLITELITRSYVMTESELLSILTALIEKAAYCNSGSTMPVKALFQSMVACVNRSRMMTMLIGGLNHRNRQIAFVILLFFREMLDYEEVVAVVCSNLPKILKMVEDHNTDVRVNAIALVRETVLTGRLPIDDVFKRMNDVTPTARGFLEAGLGNLREGNVLQSVIAEVRKQALERNALNMKVVTETDDMISDGAANDEESITSVKTEPRKNRSKFGVQVFDEIAMTEELLFSADELASFSPIPQQISEFQIDSEFDQLVYSVKQLVIVMDSVVDRRVIHVLYETEYNEGFSSLISISKILKGDQSVTEAVSEASFCCLFDTLLDLLELELRVPMTPQSVDEPLLVSVVSLMRLPFTPKCHYSQLASCLKDIPLDRIIRGCLNAMKYDRIITSPIEDRKRQENYQYLLADLCRTQKPRSMIEIILTINSEIDGKGVDEFSSRLLASMLERIRVKSMTNLESADVITIREIGLDRIYVNKEMEEQVHLIVKLLDEVICNYQSHRREALPIETRNMPQVDLSTTESRLEAIKKRAAQIIEEKNNIQGGNNSSTQNIPAVTSSIRSKLEDIKRKLEEAQLGKIQ